MNGLIFDFDGTLAETFPVIFPAFRAALLHETGKIYSDEEISAQFGPSEEGIFQKLLADRWQEGLAIYHAEYRRLHPSLVKLYPGVPELLAWLQNQGLKLAIVTGKGAASLAISVQELGLAGFFDHMESGSPIDGNKVPAITRVVSAWGFDPGTVGYLGDAPSDVRCAREAGRFQTRTRWDRAHRRHRELDRSRHPRPRRTDGRGHRCQRRPRCGDSVRPGGEGCPRGDGSPEPGQGSGRGRKDPPRDPGREP